MNKKATIGRIVIYNTTEKERQDQQSNGGNGREKLPAMVVGENENGSVNLKVQSDNLYNNIWAKDCTEGTEPGQWEWPTIQTEAPTVDAGLKAD